MPRLVPSALTVVYLIALGAFALWTAGTAWRSVTHYEPPYTIDSELPSGPPLTGRLALLLLDGVRVDALESMPFLRSLGERGASGTASVGMPSLSSPGRATLSTGAWPVVHGVTNNGRYGPPPVQSLFSLAKRESLPVAVFGSDFWRIAFGADLDLDRVREFEKELHEVDDPQELVDWQREICDQMVPYFAAKPDGLLVAGITGTDAAGHDFGGESDAYRTVVAEADACLARLVEALDDGATTFVVTADHGHIDRRGQGGHGGAEPEVLEVPLVLAGKSIESGVAGIEANQTDVAPTIAALLGLPLPANSQGRVLSETLAVAPEDLAAVERRQQEQAALRAAEMPDWDAAAAQQRARRTPVALASFALLAAALGLSLVRLKDRIVRVGVALAAFAGVYYALFAVLGLGYSLSVIVREEYLVSFFLKDLIAALMATLAAAAILRWRNLLALGVVATALFGLRVTFIHYQWGLRMEKLAPDFGWAFLAYLDLLALFTVGVTACIAAGVVALRRRRQAR